MSKATTKVDAYDSVTNTIVEALENAKSGKWKCPWDMSKGMPMNGLTSRHYNGVNILMLAITAMKEGYSSNRWFTYKQASEFGSKFDPIGQAKDGGDIHPHIRKGEKSTIIVFWQFLPTYKDAKGNVVRKPSKADIASGKVKKKGTVPLLKTYNVFNMDQMQGPFLKDGQPMEAEKETKTRLEDVDAFIAATGATIQHGGHVACYVPSLDIVRLPELEAFHTPGYYSTAFHELGHWTGAESRLGRTFGKRFGDDEYAVEELVAELTAAFLCADFQLESSLQHVEYIDHWIKVLKGDKYSIFTAAREAGLAAKMLHGEVEESADDSEVA